MRTCRLTASATVNVIFLLGGCSNTGEIKGPFDRRTTVPSEIDPKAFIIGLTLAQEQGVDDCFRRVPDQSTDVGRLNRIANDRSAQASSRAAAVFELFKHHLKPGDGLREVRAVFNETGWVTEANLYEFILLTGFIPVDMNFQDRTYSLHLFSDKDRKSDWVIYFQLSGQSEWGRGRDDGVAFLQGKVGSKGECVIKEYALCYPDGNVETFRQK